MNAIIWMDARRAVHAGHHRRDGDRPGLRAAQDHPLDQGLGRRARALGQGPDRAHPLDQAPPARRVPRDPHVPGAEGLPEPAPHRPRGGVGRLDRRPLRHGQPRPRPRRLRRSADRVLGARPLDAAGPGARGRRDRPAARGRGGRARCAGRHRGRRGNTGRAVGDARVRRARGLPGAPLPRHVVVDHVPRAVQEDGPLLQHGVAAGGGPEPLLRRQRPGDRGRVPRLAARQRALARRRARHRSRPRATRSRASTRSRRPRRSGAAR